MKRLHWWSPAVRVTGMEICTKRFWRFYGTAYHEWDRDSWIMYPIPLNWIVGWWVLFWNRLRRGPAPPELWKLKANLESYHLLWLDQNAKVRELEKRAHETDCVLLTLLKNHGETKRA